jgi:hypothetical protein
MKPKRVFETLPLLVGNNIVPQGVVDEGRIFALGSFTSANKRHARIIEVLDGLKTHVIQPFGLHPWAFTLDYSTFETDGVEKPITTLEIVRPQSDGSIFVSQYWLMPKRIPNIGRLLFRHTNEGTKITVAKSDLGEQDPRDVASLSNYPLAISLLNTRGCQIDLKRAPSIQNAKRTRIGKPPVPAHYNVNAGDYLTALGASKSGEDKGGTHASPIPHLRRAHERILSSGKRVMVSPALVNVRTEGDIAFVERRKAYKRIEDD